MKNCERMVGGNRRSLRAILQEADEQLQRGEEIPHDEFWRQVEFMPAKQVLVRRKKTERDLKANKGVNWRKARDDV